jgi:formate dehydrogenase iron-sulfur subunit
MAEKAILYDATRCTACRGCQAACKQWNENDEGGGEKTTNFGSYENPKDLSPQTWLKIEFREIESGGKVKWL